MQCIQQACIQQACMKKSMRSFISLLALGTGNNIVMNTCRRGQAGSQRQHCSILPTAASGKRGSAARLHGAARRAPRRG